MSRGGAVRGVGKSGWLAFLMIALSALPALAAAQVRPQAVTGAGGYELSPASTPYLQARPNFFDFEHALFNRVGPENTAATGDVRLPVVLILFADSPEEPHIARDDVQNALFGIGTSERGTITESYRDMSRGKLTVDGDVFGWARSGLTLDSVMGSSGSIVGERTGDFFLEALQQLDPEIDFTLYDNDGPDGIANSGDDDGFVDVITFEYLEIAMSCGGPAIWPHRSTLSNRGIGPFVTDDVGISGDTIKVADYITQSAADCSGQNVQDAAVITHEFGHALGLPDWYHWVSPELGPQGRRWILGCWALMAGGSWGCGPVEETRQPYGPAHMIGLSKSRLGWITPTDPGEVWNETIELPAVQTSGELLRLPLDDEGREFLWIEFRDQIGFDYQLPAAGVLMYREHAFVDIRSKPDPNDPDGLYPITMIEQDNNESMLRTTPQGGSRGEAGDAWGVGGATSELGALIAARLRTSELRTSDGDWTPVQIHEVSVEGDRARLVISTGRTPRLIERTDTAEVTQVRSFYAGVRIAGGIGPYTGVGEIPEGFLIGSDTDRLFVWGSLLNDEPQTFSIAARDANGNISNEVSFTVVASEEWVAVTEDLVAGLLSPNAGDLTLGETAYLDDIGNGNGRYDVGDLRKWLRENRQN